MYIQLGQSGTIHAARILVAMSVICDLERLPFFAERASFSPLVLQKEEFGIAISRPPSAEATPVSKIVRIFRNGVQSYLR